MWAAVAEQIDQFPMPAVVVSGNEDVVASNPIARALSPDLKSDRTFRAGAS